MSESNQQNLLRYDMVDSCILFQHPHMLVVGLYDGNIAVYNLRKNSGGPSYQSDAKNGKHRDIVWQVRSLVMLSLRMEWEMRV